MEMNELLLKAQRFLTSRAGGGDRRFLYAVPLDSYDEKHYRMEFYVLEGSPPKGFIVADHASRQVSAYDGAGTLLKVFQDKPMAEDDIPAPAETENPQTHLRLIARAILNHCGQLQTVRLGDPLGDMIREASLDMLTAAATSLLLLSSRAVPGVEALREEQQKQQWNLRKN